MSVIRNMPKVKTNRGRLPEKEFSGGCPLLSCLPLPVNFNITEAVFTLKCWHYNPKNEDDKENCPSCYHWDSARGRCKDEALLLAEWERVNGKYEYMMRNNKGVRVDAE